jgi:hypothetical protein
MLLATAAVAALLAAGNDAAAADRDAYAFAAQLGGLCGPGQPRHLLRVAQQAPARTEIGLYGRDLRRGGPGARNAPAAL